MLGSVHRTLRHPGAAPARRAARSAAVAAAALAILSLGKLATVPTRAQPSPPDPIAFVDIVAGNQAELFTIRADGAGRRQRTRSGGVTEAGPSRSPDGRRVAYTAQIAERQWALHVLDLDGDRTEAITQGPLDYDPAWSPRGDNIAFAAHFDIGGFIESTSLSVTPPDGLGGRPILTLEDRDHFIRHPTWSPDGARIAFTVQSFKRDAELYVVGADGSDPRRLLAHPGWDDLDPAWSPDGRRIAFASGPFTTLVQNIRHAIWLLDLETGTIGTIAADEQRDLRRPAWSADGTRIVFDARTSVGTVTRWDLHVAPATGGPLGTPMTGGREADWAPAVATLPTATSTVEPPTLTPAPTSTGPTPTGGPTQTPPVVPTFPSFPTLVPFPTFPPLEPTIPGPAPTFPPPSPTPTRTPTPSATPTVTRTPTPTTSPTRTLTPIASPTPARPVVLLPVILNHEVWIEPTATPMPTATPDAAITATPDPALTPTTTLPPTPPPTPIGVRARRR